MEHKYGEFTENQISENKKIMRKKIFFLLLIVDPHYKDEYEGIDVLKAFDDELRQLAGMNSILFEPPSMVRIISLLEAARLEYCNPDFKWNTYRKLVLDAGNEVLNIKEV